MKIKNLLKKHTLTLIGFFSAVILFWFKFLRIKFPKTLPLFLSDKLFITLFFVCLILFISIIHLINNFFNIYQTKSNIKVINIQSYIKDSLYHLDHLFKYFIKKYLNIEVEIYYINLLNFLKKHILKSKYIYLFFMFPKILLPFILFIETFFIGHIYYFYKILLLMIIPLIYNYIYYCLHWFYIKELESIECVLILYEIKEKNNKIIIEKVESNAFHFYVQEHTMDKLNIRQNNHRFNVELNPNFIKSNLQNYNETEQNNFYENYCSKALPFCSKVYEIIYMFTIQEKNLSFYINIYMILIYFICWTYILFTANYNNISIEFLYYLENFQNKYEPFSDLHILNDKK